MVESSGDEPDEALRQVRSAWSCVFWLVAGARGRTVSGHGRVGLLLVRAALVVDLDVGGVGVATGAVARGG